MGITVQIATRDGYVPRAADIKRWASQALGDRGDGTDVTVRIVGLDEGSRLNEKWRNAAGPTNVLAFPMDAMETCPGLLGDIVICADVANAEARSDGKARTAHWAHLVVHGALHLLGYDHQSSAEATEMESIERTILAELGYPDPYL